jgi:two-component system, response regulator RegA
MANSPIDVPEITTIGTNAGPAVAASGERSLLIVEDDKSFLQRLARAMEGRGFIVTTAESVAEGLLQVEKAAPAFAVVDMRLGDGNGLDVISAMKRRRPEARAIILTGYGNIATAVNAVKLGAVDYLAKPVDADDVAAALLAFDNKKIEPPENPTKWRRRCSLRARTSRPRRRTRCRPTGCAGSISSAFTNCAIVTFRRPRAGSICIAARCSASWPNARRNNRPSACNESVAVGVYRRLIALFCSHQRWPNSLACLRVRRASVIGARSCRVFDVVER